ncbi:hypothetical protein GE09DRAFT_14498 [Coniochaeta sp. 2T2.1]|nr:hypothetical protein GE09DRAFT_14498 [Coniochaeta sp. 2T2.1]
MPTLACWILFGIVQPFTELIDDRPFPCVKHRTELLLTMSPIPTVPGTRPHTAHCACPHPPVFSSWRGVLRVLVGQWKCWWTCLVFEIASELALGTDNSKPRKCNHYSKALARTAYQSDPDIFGKVKNLIAMVPFRMSAPPPSSRTQVLPLTARSSSLSSP